MKEIIDDGYMFRSVEELYTYWYFKELQDVGIVLGIQPEPPSFKLATDQRITYKRRLKTKVKDDSRLLIKGHEYTPDFLITWNTEHKDIGKFLHIIVNSTDDPKDKPFISFDSHKTYIEVKPSFDRHNMTRLFTLNQKWVFEAFDEYVNLVIPVGVSKSLFTKTFTPHRFLKTDSGKANRSIKHAIRSLSEFLAL